MFKKGLSYFIRIPIEEIKSSISGTLYVNFYKGKYIVDTTEVNYAHGELQDVFKIGLDKIKIEQYASKKTLILGFGAGCIASLLQNEYHFSNTITGVELDEKMIAIFQKYYGEKIPATVIQDDVVSYVQTTNEKFGVVLIDVFVHDKVPQTLQNESFILALKKCLESDGIIVWNYMTTKSHIKNTAALENLLAAHFSSVRWFMAGDYNKLLVMKNK